MMCILPLTVLCVESQTLISERVKLTTQKMQKEKHLKHDILKDNLNMMYLTTHVISWYASSHMIDVLTGGLWPLKIQTHMIYFHIDFKVMTEY